VQEASGKLAPIAKINKKSDLLIGDRGNNFKIKIIQDVKRLSYKTVTPLRAKKATIAADT
jgi:hypothetical protein